MSETRRRKAPWLAAAAVAPAVLACAEPAGRSPGPPRAIGERPRAESAEAPGRAIAFERERDGNTDLWVVAAEGGVERRLTRHPAKDILPRWTPDGAAIVFSSLRDGHWQLYRVELQGGRPERLRANPHREWQADPTPDGEGYAFLSSLDGPEGLFVVPWSGGAPRRLVQHGQGVDLGNPDWSLDMRRIVYSSNRGVGGHRTYVLDLEAGDERRVSPLAEGGCEPRFAPEGRRVAWVRRQHLTRDRSWIVEGHLESGEQRELVAWQALNYDPVYSPEGDEIAFASTVAGEYAIYRMRLADGQSWRVSFGPGGARHPDYRPAPR